MPYSEVCNNEHMLKLEYWAQVLVIGKISNAVVLAGAAYQDEAGYARMTGLPRERTRLLDDKGRTDTQVGVTVSQSGQLL